MEKLTAYPPARSKEYTAFSDVGNLCKEEYKIIPT